MRPNALLIHGDARHLPLRDESVQCEEVPARQLNAPRD